MQSHDLQDALNISTFSTTQLSVSPHTTTLIIPCQKCKRRKYFANCVRKNKNAFFHEIHPVFPPFYPSIFHAVNRLRKLVSSFHRNDPQRLFFEFEPFFSISFWNKGNNEMSTSSPKRKRTLLYVLIGASLLLLAAVIYKARQKPKGENVTVEKSQRRSIKETVSPFGNLKVV